MSKAIKHNIAPAPSMIKATSTIFLKLLVISLTDSWLMFSFRRNDAFKLTLCLVINMMNPATVKKDNPPISIRMAITIFPKMVISSPTFFTTDNPVTQTEEVDINSASIKDKCPFL